jgi:integrase
MAHLQKISVVRYIDRNGNRVSKGTKGAKKVREKSDKWYGVWRAGGKQVRVPLSTDKESSQVMLADLLRQRERGRAGLTSPYAQELERPLSEHVADYLAHLKAQSVTDKHFSERSRCLLAVIDGCSARALSDLTVEKLDRYLAALESSARTRDTYRAAVLGLLNWLEDKGRIERNWLDKITKPKGEAVRVRRALSPEQLQAILNVTRERPLRESSTIRRGPRKGQQVGKLQPHVRERLALLGMERALIYKTAIYTGLRRREVAALQVCHLDLDGKPYPSLTLPGQHTKNGEAAKMLLVPSFAEELRHWIADTRRLPEDRLFSVRNEMVKTLKADLKAAGIPFEDEQGRTADFQSLRMTADTMLGVVGVPARVRQLFMRHSDIRLTLQTYDDSSRYELQDAVKALEKLNLR